MFLEFNLLGITVSHRPPTPEFPDYDDFSSGVIIVGTPMTGSNDKASSRRQLSEGYMKASLSMDVLHKQKQLKSHHNPYIPHLLLNCSFLTSYTWLRQAGTTRLEFL